MSTRSTCRRCRCWASRAAGRSPCSARRRASRSGAAPTSPIPRATAGRASSTCCAASRRPSTTSRTRSRPTARACCRPCSARQPARPSSSRATARRSRSSFWTRSPSASPRNAIRCGAASDRRRSSPRPICSRCCGAAGCATASNTRLFQSVTVTLDRMCQGGIYDHLGGGFARYATDNEWLIPHFEKMLYDNAQLVDLLTLVWQETKSPLYATRIAETCDWVLREMVAERRRLCRDLRRRLQKASKASSMSGTRPRSMPCWATTRPSSSRSMTSPPRATGSITPSCTAIARRRC